MGPTKAIVKENRLYEVVGGKLIKDGFASRQELEDYVNHHYLTLPVLDNAGNTWLLDGKLVYCLRAHNTKPWTIRGSSSRAARIAVAWESGQMNLRSNRIVFVARPAGMNSMRDWK